MKNYPTIKSLTEDSIRVTPGMITVYPQFGEESVLNLSDLVPKFNGRYATNNSTVCFVYENEIYVTPYTTVAINCLRSNGFGNEYFYVPFSNGDYPKFEQYRWMSLREQAKSSYEEEFKEDCEAFCDKHHIGALDEATLASCFEMPATGVKVKHFYYETCYYPIFRTSCLDCTVADQIGHFCTNNGKVVFTYRNGKTYVAKGYKLVSELRSLGYKEDGLFVPFSNGEQILDPVLRQKWEGLPKF